MKQFCLYVSVDENNDYLGDVYVDVELSDEMYDRLVKHAEQCHQNEEEFTEEMLQEQFPDIYAAINAFVDNKMPEEIDMDEGQDISDFSWYVQFSDDLCDELLDGE